jgi:hypothetical protein
MRHLAAFWRWLMQAGVGFMRYHLNHARQAREARAARRQRDQNSN